MSTASVFGKFGCTAASAASIVRRSIISTAAGTMPSRDDRGHRFAGRVDRLEAGEQRHARLSGRRSIRTSRLGDDRQRAFGADEHAEQIEPGRVERGAAEVHELAVGQHRLDAEHVVDGEAVLQAVRAAGVLGDVAANRADDLARRVGRVVAAERRDPPRDLEVGDARLDDDPQVGDVDVEDAVEPRQADEHAVGDRQRAAGQAGAVPARDERHAVAPAQPDDRLHLLGRLGQHDRRRRRPQVHEPSDSYVRRSAGS